MTKVDFMTAEMAKRHYFRKTKKTVIEFVAKAIKKGKYTYGCMRFPFGDVRYAKGNIFGEIRSDYLTKKIKIVEVFRNYIRRDYLLILEDKANTSEEGIEE